MKRNHNHDHGLKARTLRMPILFELSHSSAITICVADTFDRWQSEAKTLHPARGGHWWKETALLPGTH
jgi:hypothetical protein